MTGDEDQVTSCGTLGIEEDVGGGEAVATSDQDVDVALWTSEKQQREFEQQQMEEVHSSTVDLGQPESMETEEVGSCMAAPQVEAYDEPAAVQGLFLSTFTRSSLWDSYAINNIFRVLHPWSY